MVVIRKLALITLSALVSVGLALTLASELVQAYDVDFAEGWEHDTTGQWDSVTGSITIRDDMQLSPMAFSGSDSNVGVYGSNWFAQTFTTPGTTSDVYRITNTWIYTATHTGTPSGTLYLDIMDVDGSGHPTGTSYGQASLACSDVGSGSQAQLDWTLDDIPVIQGNTQYAMRIYVSGDDASNHINIKYNTTSTGAGGNYEYSTDSGSTWYAQSSYDFACLIRVGGTTGRYLFDCSCSESAKILGKTSSFNPIREATFTMLLQDSQVTTQTKIFGCDTGLWLEITTNGEIDLHSENGGKEADGTTTLSVNVWYRISVASDTTDDKCYVWIDGVIEHNGISPNTALDNHWGTSSSEMEIGVCDAVTASIAFDDLVTTQNPYGNTDLGALKVEALFADAQGTDNDSGSGVDWQGWEYGTGDTTVNYAYITDIGFNSDAYHDYNWAEADGGMMRWTAHTYELADMNDDTISTVRAVQWLWLYETQGGGASYNYVQYDQTVRTEVAIDDPKVPTLLVAVENDAPSDSDAWTEALTNGLEIGMSTDDANKDLFFYDGHIQVVYTATTATPDISNTPSTKDFGVVAESSTYWSNGSTPSFPLTDPDAYFTVTNNGSASVDIDFKATNFTGGVGWTLTSGTPGSNTVKMSVFIEGDGSGDGDALTTSNQTLITSLASSADIDWEIKLETGTFTDGAEKTSTITLTASLSYILLITRRNLWRLLIAVIMARNKVGATHP